MMLFRLKLPQIISCKELKYDNRWTCQIRISIWRNETGIAQTFLTFFPREVHFALILQFFLHEICLIIFWREILKKTLLKFLPKMLLVETLCKLVQIFPPKVLYIYSYIHEKFLTTFLTNVIKVNLRQKTLFDSVLIEYCKTIKDDTKTDHYTLYWLVY